MNKNSKYSVEIKSEDTEKYPVESIPPGVDRVLDILGNSIDISDPYGTLEIIASKFRGSPGETFPLIVTYKNPDGLFEPDKIYITGMEGTVEGYSKIFQLPVIKGMTMVYEVGAFGADKKIKVSTIDSSAG